VDGKTQGREFSLVRARSMRFPVTLKQNADFDAVGFGTNAVDHLIRVPHYPDFGSKVEFDEVVIAPGGEVATAMVGLQRLGMRTAYAGRFGSDEAGSIGISSLAEEGVDTAYCERIDGARTQQAFIVIDIQTGERTVIWKRDARLAYTERDAPLEAAARCRVLHLTPHDTAACIAMAEIARTQGAVVSVDIDNVFEGIENLLKSVDIMVASSDFPEKLTGRDNLREALAEIASRFGCPVVGCTLGDRGSLLFAGGAFIESGGFSVPGGCKDTTGAGDSFRAGLLYGLLSGAEIEESARMANAVAALKCRALGARTSLPTPGELAALLPAGA
jgi:sulfofructose kinase